MSVNKSVSKECVTEKKFYKKSYLIQEQTFIETIYSI